MSGESHRDRGKLGGLLRGQIIRELALGDMTQRALAEKYDVSDAAITKFKQRNADAIAAVRADAEDEFAGLLIAQKVRRVAAYEDILRSALAPKPKITNKGTYVIDPSTGEYVYEIDAGAAMTALKNVAEEMGQLVNRQSITGDMQTTTTYRVEGINPDEDLT